MSDPETRAELCDTLRALTDAAPTMRIGQIVAAAGEICNDLHGRGLWDAEDRELLEAIWKLKQNIESNLPAEVHPPE